MPSRLKRYQHGGSNHFLTFSCYRRLAMLNSAEAKQLFERTLEEVRRWYRFDVFGYMVMPEHVHLLVSEPTKDDLSVAIQMLKQLVSRRLRGRSEGPFWQTRYYDFNVMTDPKFMEKLKYIHRNPVNRGLVQEPQDWPWSSYRHYLTGEKGTVRIGSEMTFRKWEKQRVEPRFLRKPE